ncbi:MAG: lipid-A-disaccharide synthase [Brevinematales bacterium]|nr:lipid-A-disaccharide synthase [Brevinematales bacterium]
MPPRKGNNSSDTQSPSHQKELKAEKTFFFSAGEISGDAHASELIGELSAMGRYDFVGLGGKQMFEAGLRSAFGDVSTLSTVGFVESLNFIGKKVRLLRNSVEFLKKNPPAAVILVDNQGFNILLGREAKKLGIPVFYYIPPTVSVWAEWNAPKVAAICDHLICNISADMEIYRRYTENVYYPGHPTVDKIAKFVPDAGFLKKLGLTPGKPVVSIFPGSRHQELRKLLGIMLDAAKILIESDGYQVILPVSHAKFRGTIERAMHARKLDGRIALVEDDPYSVMHSASVNIMASGTATLESVLMRRPPVICYRISPISFAIAKRLVKKQMIGLPNIFLDRKVFPELLQRDCNPRKIAQTVRELISPSPELRALLEQSYDGVRDIVGEPGVSSRAARYILDRV